MKKATFIAAALTASVAGSAVALPSTIQVGVGGGELGLRAYDFSSTVFGDSMQGEFTGTALASLHDVLNDQGGVTTENWITVVAGFVDTNNDQVADETALLWLIDDQDTGQGMATPGTNITFNSSINKDTGAAVWINDIGDGLTVIPEFGGDALATGSFEWDNDTGNYGDAFAWSGLGTNDTGAFNFSSIVNWNGFEGIQFVSYDSSSDSWTVLQQLTGSSALQAFSFTVIPFPPAALIGLAGLAGVGVIRRRIAG